MPNTNNDDLMSRFDDLQISNSRKVPICLVLDVSGSMGDRDGTRLTKIEELNKNYREFISFVRKDANARAICDLSVISFGDSVTVINGYSNIESVHDTKFTSNGPTPMGAAMSKALELLELRRSYYKKNSIEHYKPIVLLMTDGEATDDFQASAAQFASKVREKRVKILPIIIGQNNKSKALAAFSPLYPPKQIKSSEDFAELFRLLSSSTSNPTVDPWDKFMGGAGEGETV
jgi:uncharacterized protein YegL